jgi:hypothetical protein
MLIVVNAAKIDYGSCGGWPMICTGSALGGGSAQPDLDGAGGVPRFSMPLGNLEIFQVTPEISEISDPSFQFSVRCHAPAQL